MSDCGETFVTGCTPPQLYRMARRLLLALFAATAAASRIVSAELCELAIALYDAHLAAHCLETEESFLSSIEKDEVTREIFNRIARMAIVMASRYVPLVRVSIILGTVVCVCVCVCPCRSRIGVIFVPK